MRSMLKGSGALVAMLLLVASTAASAYNRVEKPLYAGQHILVGKLIVEQYKVNTKKYLRVTYDTTSSNWGMTTTHLYVSKNKPTRAAPGRFPFKHEGLDNVKIDVYEIPLSQLLCSDQYLYIAAHADVCEETACVPDFAATAGNLPSLVTGGSYQDFLKSFAYIASPQFGNVLVWCIDELQTLYITGAAADYSATPLLSYDGAGNANTSAISLLGAVGASAGNTVINALNFLINQQYVKDLGTSTPFAFGTITSGTYGTKNYGTLTVTANEVQVAIWNITDGTSPNAFATSVDFPADPLHVEAILAHIQANGGGSYVPGCGDLVLAFMDPILTGYENLEVQNLAFAVPMVGNTGTGDCETAWAKGTCYFSTGWGSYFKYTVK